MTTRVLRTGCYGFCLALVSGCSEAPPTAAAPDPPIGVSAPKSEPDCLVDITHQAGLAFIHQVPAEHNFSMPDILGSGAAAFDANLDGRLDLYLVNSRGANRLYLQRADGRLEDTTSSSGAGDLGYGMGSTLGDIDNDGDLDLYVTNLGQDVLLRNNGDGTFEDVSAAWGINIEDWSVSSGFFDYDQDGWLDLYVVKYVDYDPSKRCASISGRPDYCGPTAFPPVADLLLRNHAGQRFENVSNQFGFADKPRAGLGLAIADFNNNDRLDLLVANDGEENQLWLHTAEGFSELGVAFGVAVNQLGRTEAGMGVVLADLNGDLELDLLLTHLENESNTLYLNRNGTGLEDRSGGSGLAMASLPWTGFGVDALDLDLDGDLEIAIANGKVRFTNLGRTGAADGDEPRTSSSASQPQDTSERYAEPNLIFDNLGQGKFEKLACARTFTDRRRTSRGLLAADYDGDGDADLLITNNQGPAELWENVSPRGNWLSVRAIDPGLGRDAIGAIVRVHTNESSQVRPISHVRSYLMAGEATALFGLGTNQLADSVEIHWPGGDWESFGVHRSNQTLVLEKGRGAR